MEVQGFWSLGFRGLRVQGFGVCGFRACSWSLGVYACVEEQCAAPIPRKLRVISGPYNNYLYDFCWGGGVPVYNYSMIYPQTLFEFLRPPKACTSPETWSKGEAREVGCSSSGLRV